MVPEVAGGMTEDRVSDAAFELVFAFDEVSERSFPHHLIYNMIVN